MAADAQEMLRQNRVFLNRYDVIEMHVVGDQTAESVRAIGDEAVRLADDCRRRGLPVLLSDNLLAMGTVPPEGRRVVVEYGKKAEFDRLAMVGKGALLRLGSNLLIQAIGKSDRLRYFEDELSAMHWLRAFAAGAGQARE